MRGFAFLSVAVVLSACASKSSDVAPSYVSPMTYQSYTCQQLAQEAQSVSARAAQAAGARMTSGRETKSQLARLSSFSGQPPSSLAAMVKQPRSLLD
jgi:hypothetical protein